MEIVWATGPSLLNTIDFFFSIDKNYWRYAIQIIINISPF